MAKATIVKKGDPLYERIYMMWEANNNAHTAHCLGKSYHVVWDGDWPKFIEFKPRGVYGENPK